MVSPSARRAWVEMSCSTPDTTAGLSSPSARRAWVEIIRKEITMAAEANVALRKEGVG